MSRFCCHLCVHPIPLCHCLLPLSCFVCRVILLSLYSSTFHCSTFTRDHGHCAYTPIHASHQPRPIPSSMREWTWGRCAIRLHVYIALARALRRLAVNYEYMRVLLECTSWVLVNQARGYAGALDPPNMNAQLNSHVRERNYDSLMSFLIRGQHDDVNQMNEEGHTALHLACKVNHCTAVNRSLCCVLLVWRKTYS